MIRLGSMFKFFNILGLHLQLGLGVLLHRRRHRGHVRLHVRVGGGGRALDRRRRGHRAKTGSRTNPNTAWAIFIVWGYFYHYVFWGINS